MIKKARYCDVCGKEIPWREKRYKFYEIVSFAFFGDEKYPRDMCKDCYSKFIEFVGKGEIK